MSYALQVAGKIALWALLWALIAGVSATIVTAVPLILQEVGLDVSGFLSVASTYLSQGRGLVNLFINGYVFNLCVGVWLALLPPLLSAQLVRLVVAHMRS